MSEYLSKKAVLEWLDDRRYKSPWIESFRDLLESGAFDVPLIGIEEYYTMERKAAKAGWEVQRLREKLDWAARIIGNVLDRGIYVDYDPWDWMQKYHQWMKNEAFSGSGAREKEEPNHDAG